MNTQNTKKFGYVNNQLALFAKIRIISEHSNG